MATLSVAGAVVLLVGVIGLIALNNHRDHSTDVAYRPGPTTTSTAASTVPSAPSTPSTGSESTDGASTSPDDSTEAPAPTGQEGPQPVKELGDNPLFADADTGLPNQGCELARWHTDASSAARFYRTAISCLDAEWRPVLDAANLPFRTPKLSAPASGGGASPCASSGESFAAYYCPTNETIYMPWQTMQPERFGAHPGVYLAVLAHEYGHHVQTLAGVMDAASDQQYDAGGGDSDKGLAIQRRLELQAQCFSGMFLGATANRGGDVDQNIFDEASQTQDRGDHGDGPRSHGTDEHSEAWWSQGAKYNRTQRCNTWAATSGDTA